MRLREMFLVKIFLITLLSGCSLLKNNKVTVSNKISESLLIKENFFSSVAWRIFVGRKNDFYSILHPAYANGVVYIADCTGNVKAINANNGEEIWSVNLAKKKNHSLYEPLLLSGGITVSDNHIYIGSEKAIVYSLNIKDGSVAWKVHTVGEILSNPVISDGMVLIHTGNGYLVALNELTGSVKWIVNFGTPVLSFRGESTPSVVSNIAIVGDDKGYVNAVLIQDGSVVWRYPSSFNMNELTDSNCFNDIDFSPIIIGNKVYVLSYNGNLTALDLFSGEILWKRKFNSISNFTANNDCIYLINKNNDLFAINVNNGVVLWRRGGLLHCFLTEPVLCHGNLIVGDDKGYVYWIDQVNGFFVFKKRISRFGFLGSPIAIGNRLLLFQVKNGFLYAIFC